MLSKEDFSVINKLISICESIKENYLKLEYLELNGLKTTTEYEDTLEYLKSSLSLEQNIYTQIDFDKIILIIEFLENCEYMNGLREEFQALFQKNDLVISRIIIKLFEILNKNFKMRLEEIFPKELYDMLDISSKEKILKDLKYAIILLYTLKNDIVKCYLAILDEKYIKMKYRISFLFSEIESYFLQSNFKINITPYLNYRFISDLYNKQTNVVDSLNAEYIFDNFLLLAQAIYKFTDTDLENNMDNFILQQKLLIAMLLLLNEEQINELKELLYPIFILRNKETNKEQIINLILSVFEEKINYMKIPRVLSLKI